MTAVDTNVVVRLLTADDPKQSAASLALFAAGPVWISKTVWLETAWVISSVYNFDDNTIRGAFSKLLSLSNVHTENKQSISAALSLMAHGIEFADAVHLTGRPSDAAFVSFDRALIRRSKRAGVEEIHDIAV